MASNFRGAGVEVVDITDTFYNATAISVALDVQAFEHREGLNSYLAGPNLTGDSPASFEELYTSAKFLVIPAQYGFINSFFVSSTSNDACFTAQRGIQNLTNAMRATFPTHKLDALIYAEQKNLVVEVGLPSQSGRNGMLAAFTGSPVVVIPAGFSSPSEEAAVGVPIGMDIIGFHEPKAGYRALRRQSAS